MYIYIIYIYIYIYIYIFSKRSSKACKESEANFLKRDSNAGVSSKICENIENTYFEEHLPTAASKQSIGISVTHRFS